MARWVRLFKLFCNISSKIWVWLFECNAHNGVLNKHIEMSLYFVTHLLFTGLLPKAEKHQSTPMVCITCDMYNGRTGFCTLMRRESSDQRVVQTNQTNNEHKIDLFTSAPLVPSGALATGSSNIHWKQMLILLQLLVSRKIVPKLQLPSFFSFAAIPDQAPTRLLSKQCSSMMNSLNPLCVCSSELSERNFLRNSLPGLWPVEISQMLDPTPPAPSLPLLLLPRFFNSPVMTQNPKP